MEATAKKQRKEYIKRNNKKAKYKRHRRDWTKEEIEFLKESYGKRNIDNIASSLKRTPLGIKQKAKQIFKGLKIYEIQGNYSTVELGKALGNSSSLIIRSWIKKHEMPVITIKNDKGTVTHYIIEVDKFWDWLKDNKENVSIDMRVVDLEVLDYYPDWFLDDVEAGNSYRKKNVKKWGDKEFEILNKMYYEKNCSIKEIAFALNRSYGSVAEKIARETRNRLTRVAK